MPEMNQEDLAPYLGQTVKAKIRFYGYHTHLQSETGVICRADEKPDGTIGLKFRGHFAIPHEIVEGLKCPYCKLRVENTNEPNFVNGIKTLEASECEFCNPELDTYGIYTETGLGLDTIEAFSRDEALKIFKAKPGVDQDAEYWVESVYA